MAKNSLFSKSYLSLFFSGFAMGAADLIPGVSGGTIALIVGIYENLIKSINHVVTISLSHVLKGRLRQAITSVPFHFLIPIGLGILTAIFSLANLISYLLFAYPQYIWSFFFGLVASSCWTVAKKVKVWSSTTIILLALSTTATYLVVGSVPFETPATLPMFFFSGMIAIIAMILPGISGSFILVLLGKYQQVLTAVTQRDSVTIATVALGAILGLGLFSKILTWLFKKHHDLTMAILTGIMLGSLRKIWPYKETLTYDIDHHGDLIPIKQINIIPQTVNEALLFSILLTLIAVALVIYLSKFDTKHQK